MYNLHELMHTLPYPGTVEWIGIRPARQVTLLQYEHLKVIAAGECRVGDALHVLTPSSTVR